MGEIIKFEEKLYNTVIILNRRLQLNCIYATPVTNHDAVLWIL